ncbi:MAG: hypothetical protein IK084_05285 [Bacteroidaceae bacterium]|nr:hypothetical protein [Bacteroidaceae bacterium]
MENKKIRDMAKDKRDWTIRIDHTPITEEEMERAREGFQKLHEERLRKMRARELGLDSVLDEEI